jgi:hypothetical protein
MNQLLDGDIVQVGPNDLGVFDGYCYQWFAAKDGGPGDYEGVAAALGGNGQIIVYLPNSNTTIAIMGQGCGGSQGNLLLLSTIISNLGDLSVEQTACTQSFSYWKYYTKNAVPLMKESIKSLPSRLFSNGGPPL